MQIKFYTKCQLFAVLVYCAMGYLWCLLFVIWYSTLSTKLRGRQANCCVLLLHWSTGTTQYIEIESTYGMHLVCCYSCVYWDNFVHTLGIFVLFVRVS